ncbi:Major facilitator superfamily domain, general substrate transporter, partial [Nannochloropsis gaditana]
MTPATPKPVGPTGTSAAHAHTLAGEDSDHHTKAIEMGDLPSENAVYDAWAHEEDGEERTAIPLAVASPFPGKHSRATLINPWSRINWGITVGTFVYNLTSTFLVIPMGFYVVQDLMMDGRALNVVQSMLLLPQALQLPLGLLSDCVPIAHQRRKPYIIIGWLINLAAMAALAAVDTPSISILLPLVFLSTCGGQLIDIAGKALV